MLVFRLLSLTPGCWFVFVFVTANFAPLFVFVFSVANPTLNHVNFEFGVLLMECISIREAGGWHARCMSEKRVGWRFRVFRCSPQCNATGEEEQMLLYRYRNKHMHKHKHVEHVQQRCSRRTKIIRATKTQHWDVTNAPKRSTPSIPTILRRSRRIRIITIAKMQSPLSCCCHRVGFVYFLTNSNVATAIRLRLSNS